jgi:hypothetical protein
MVFAFQISKELATDTQPTSLRAAAYNPHPTEYYMLEKMVLSFK